MQNWTNQFDSAWWFTLGETWGAADVLVFSYVKVWQPFPRIVFFPLNSSQGSKQKFLLRNYNGYKWG